MKQRGTSNTELSWVSTVIKSSKENEEWVSTKTTSTRLKFNQDIHIARWLLIQVSFLIYYSSLVQVSQDRTIFMSFGKLVFLIMQLLLKLLDLSFHFLNMILCSGHSFTIFFSSGTYLFSWYWALSGNDRLQLYKFFDENHCLLETHLDLSIASASSSSTITVSHFLSTIFSCLCWIAFWMKACRSSGLFEFATNKWDCKTNQDSIAIVC